MSYREYNISKNWKESKMSGCMLTYCSYWTFISNHKLSVHNIFNKFVLSTIYKYLHKKNITQILAKFEIVYLDNKSYFHIYFNTLYSEQQLLYSVQHITLYMIYSHFITLLLDFSLVMRWYDMITTLITWNQTASITEIFHFS